MNSHVILANRWGSRSLQVLQIAFCRRGSFLPEKELIFTWNNIFLPYRLFLTKCLLIYDPIIKKLRAMYHGLSRERRLTLWALWDRVPELSYPPLSYLSTGTRFHPHMVSLLFLSLPPRLCLVAKQSLWIPLSISNIIILCKWWRDLTPIHPTGILLKHSFQCLTLLLKSLPWFPGIQGSGKKILRTSSPSISSAMICLTLFSCNPLHK